MKGILDTQFGNRKLDESGQFTWIRDAETEGLPADTYFYIYLYRRIRNEDIENYNNEQMPGFKLSWNFSNNVVLQAMYKGQFLSNEFMRYKVFVYHLVYLEKI